MKEIVPFIMLVMVVNATGPDPWGESHDDVKPITNPTSKIDDIFYKNVLKILLNRAYIYGDDMDQVEGIINLSMSKKDFDTLENLAMRSTKLTITEFRSIDEIMSNGILHPSINQRLNFGVPSAGKLVVTYWREVILIIGICFCIYKLKSFNWTMIFTLRGLFIIVCFLAIVWEYCIAYQEAENKTINDIYEIPTWYSYLTSFFSTESHSNIPKATVSHHWEYLHPYTILSRLIKRLIYKPSMDLFAIVNTISYQACSNLPWPLSTILHLVSTFMCIGIMLMFPLIFIFTVLLNYPFKLSFLGLNFNILGRRQNNQTRSNTESNQTHQDSPNRDVEFKLIDMCSSLINVVTSHLSSNRPAIEQNKEASTSGVKNKQSGPHIKRNRTNNGSSNLHSKNNQSEDDYETMDEDDHIKSTTKKPIFRTSKDRKKFRSRKNM